MGFFSWVTADEHDSLWSHYCKEAMVRELIPCPENPCFVVTPDDKEYKVIWYDGYGHIMIELTELFPKLLRHRQSVMQLAVGKTEQNRIGPMTKKASFKTDAYQYYVSVFILAALQNGESVDKDVVELVDCGIHLDTTTEAVRKNIEFVRFATRSGWKYSGLKNSNTCPYQGFFYYEEEKEDE